MSIKFLDRKDQIQGELIKAAKAGAPFPTYEEFGQRVGIWRMRGAKDVLDQIAREEVEQGRPDITFILRSAATGYPSQIGFESAKPPKDWQKHKAREEMQKVIEKYCLGATNPY